MFQYRPLITPQIDNTIQELIKELEFLPNLCEKISENVNKQYATNFTSIQIRQYLKDMLQVKIPQNRGEPFTEQIDNSIKEFMREVGQLSLSNPYVKIKEKINKQYNKNYTSKQIRQRWISKLNTNLCHEPLDNDEKLFIIRWAENTPRARGDKINWKDLIPMMNHQFGKLRSESVVKNFWNLRKRSQENKSKTENENSRKRKRCSKSKEKDEQQHKKICPEFITFEYKNEKYIKSSSPNGGLNASPMKKLFKNEKKNPSSPLNQNPIEILSENEENIPTPPLKAIPMEILSENEENIPTSPLNSNSIEILSENEENVPSSPLNANPVELLFENEEHTPSSAMEILCLVADAMYKRDFSRSELNYNVCR